MAPNNEIHLSEEQITPSAPVPVKTHSLVKTPIVWRNVILFVYLHLAALYGLYLAFFEAKLATTLCCYVLYVSSGLGITAGAHRLWAHRSYKARFPLRVMLMCVNSMAMQNHIYEWSRDHRLHHKFSETDADPHNAKRGFFFAHMGWLMCRKHPEVKAKGSTIDMSDLLADPVVTFQKKYYVWLCVVWGLVFPMLVPMILFGETAWNSFFLCTIFRYCYLLHATWMVNSAAHLWGDKPYDKHINPAENLMTTMIAIGEGFHNYHHTFPWDYKASEWGWKINYTTFFIDLWAKMGLAYDRKIAQPIIVNKRRLRTGDRSQDWFPRDTEH